MKIITLLIALITLTMPTMAVTHIKFNNLTGDEWTGHYHPQSYVMPANQTTEWDIEVTEPGAWCFVFGDQFTGDAYGDDTFNEDYEGVTFEYTVSVELVPSDKGPEFPPDRVYTIIRDAH